MAASNADLSIFLGTGLASYFRFFSSSDELLRIGNVAIFLGNGFGYTLGVGSSSWKILGWIFPGTVVFLTNSSTTGFGYILPGNGLGTGVTGSAYSITLG